LINIISNIYDTVDPYSNLACLGGLPMPSHDDPLGLQRFFRRLSVKEPGRDQGRIESDGLALDVWVEPPVIIGLDQFRTEYSIDQMSQGERSESKAGFHLGIGWFKRVEDDTHKSFLMATPNP
jgi:hypothetical protein